MPSGGKTKHDLAYFTDNPWNGESDDFEQWQKVLALRGLDLGGPLMRAWVLGEGPTLEPQNVETIGYAIHAHIEARASTTRSFFQN